MNQPCATQMAPQSSSWFGRQATGIDSTHVRQQQTQAMTIIHSPTQTFTTNHSMAFRVGRRKTVLGGPSCQTACVQHMTDVAGRQLHHACILAEGQLRDSLMAKQQQPAGASVQAGHRNARHNQQYQPHHQCSLQAALCCRTVVVLKQACLKHTMLCNVY